VATDKALSRLLDQLFDAERTARNLHDELAGKPRDELFEALTDGLQTALQEPGEDESALRLVRIAALLGELEGPRVVDALIDILASEQPEARHAAGGELEALAFDRFREVAEGVERALSRLPVGSPALPELPYLLAEVPEPGVAKLLGRFLAHDDADAVAAAIEALVEIGDPSVSRLIAPLVDDSRTVEMADESSETTSEVTIGELAADALALLQDLDGGDGGDETPAMTARRGGTS
jgi:HEAT repeat protein